MAPAAAPAYRYLSLPWPGHTVPYFNAAGRYGAQVRAAARAWNASGARIRWVAVPRARARVVIVIAPLPVSGLATTFSPGHGRIQLSPTIRRGQPSAYSASIVVTQVVVHEMGHILGLNHETRRCAIMNTVLGPGRPCPDPGAQWKFRCRLLERDDIAGAVALFGGRIGPLGSAECGYDRTPPAVTGLTARAGARAGGGQRIRLAWTAPRSAPRNARYQVLRRAGQCPSGIADRRATLVESDRQVRPGRGESSADAGAVAPRAGTARYCYLVAIVTAYGQPGRSATAAVQLGPDPPPSSPGQPTGPRQPAQPPAANLAPTASFDFTADPDPLTFDFLDGSYDDDGTITAWSWNFGDGTTSAAPSPRHAYAAPGDYTVTLTVTDNAGATATTSLTITAS